MTWPRRTWPSTSAVGLRLRNPVIAASGTFGYGLEFAGVTDLRALGAIVVKGLSLEPHRGHPRTAHHRDAGGNAERDRVAEHRRRGVRRREAPALRQYGTPIVANCWGHEPEEFAEVAARLSQAEGLAAVEINVSCPEQARMGTDHRHRSRPDA